MIDIEVKNSGGRVVVKISGNLNILHALRLRDAMMKTLGACNSVELHVNEMEGIDLSSLQIFCAAHKMALDMKKDLIVASAIPDVIRQIVIGSGYARRIGCSLDKDNSCLWIKEATNE